MVNSFLRKFMPVRVTSQRSSEFVSSVSPSFVKNQGEISKTYQDAGIYGRFINKSRLEAYQYALMHFDVDLSCILDVGCSYGSWAENWRSLGFEKLCGIDPNPEAVAKAQAVFDEVNVAYSMELKKLYPRNNFIVANGVLVHILEEAQTVKFFQDVSGCLSPQGRFFFTVVNAKFYYSTGRKEWVGLNSCTRYLENYRAFIEQAGLEILEGGEIGTFIDPWALPELEYIASKEGLRKDWSLYQVFIDLAAIVRGISTSPFSEVLFVTGRKP